MQYPEREFIFNSSEEEEISVIEKQKRLDDKIGKEIERLIIDVYNSHISNEPRPDDQASNHEQDFELYCQSLHELSSLLILQILLQKIKTVVKKYKQKIFENPEIRAIREKYIEQNTKNNKSYMGNISENEDENSPKHEFKNFIYNQQNNQTIKLILPPFPTEETPAEQGNANGGHHVKNCSNVINIFLYDLKCIKQSLIESSKDIERIFKHPLSFLKDNNQIVKFQFENIHIEEFSKIILNDGFISLLLLQIKNIAQKNLKGTSSVLHYIEDNPLSPSNESTKINDFITQKINALYLPRVSKRLNLLSDENDKDLLFPDNVNKSKNIPKAQIEKIMKTTNTGVNEEEKNETKKLENSTANNITTINNNTKISNNITTSKVSKGVPINKPVTTKNTAKKSKNNSSSNDTKELDIDQLVSYILQNENKNGKKTKKKKNKKNKNNSDNNSMNAGTITENQNLSVEKNEIEDEQRDKEIEIAKKSIKDDSCNKYTIRKIHPHLSQDWLNSITISI